MMSNQWGMGYAVLFTLASFGATAQAYAPETEVTVVTGTRLAEEPFEQPYAFYRMNLNELDAGIGRTALDQMNYGPGVFVQRTAPNQASPYIRGLTGEQTLLMFDGIRLSHSFMRSGPNQYSALVSDYSLSSIDFILGSSSSVNGSDGLTGALDFRLAPAGRGLEHGIATWGKTRFDTGNGITIATGIDGAAGDWSYSVEAGGSSFHDRVGGDNFRDHVFGSASNSGNKIPNTGYDEYSGALRLAYRGIADHALQLNLGHKRQLEAPRPDGYFENTGRTDRIYRYFDPQTFTYLHLKDTWSLDTALIDRLDTKLWWHQISEDQFRSSFRDQGTANERIRRREYDDTLDVFGIDLQATTLLGSTDQHALTWGATYIDETTGNHYREFRTPRGSTDLALLAPHNPENWSNNTTVTDNSSYRSAGLFLQDNWQLADRFSLLLGMRYSYYEWSFGQVDGDVDDITGSVRAMWQVAEHHRLFAGISRGFRAPNLTSLDGLSDRGSSGILTSGNPDLDPEVSFTYEAGWKWRQDRNEFSLTLFHTFIDDLIQSDASTTPAITKNVEDATLYGFESLLNYGVEIGANQRLALISSMTWIHATRDIPLPGGATFEDNLSRANRFYGRIGLEYERGDNWSGLFQIRWHDAYDEVARFSSGSDAVDVRLTVAGNPDGSMPGYGVGDLMFGWKSDTGKRSIRLFIENLADKTYREPGSSVDGVGRNFGVTATIRL